MIKKELLEWINKELEELSKDTEWKTDWVEGSRSGKIGLLQEIKSLCSEEKGEERIDKIDMGKTAIKSIDTLISEGSRIDGIDFERQWKEIVDPNQPWVAKRERSGYARIVIDFVPAKEKAK